MIEEKMSTLFTKQRRVNALKDFQARLEMTLQKKKLKKKELEKRFYDYDFKPKTNKKRINIYNNKVPAKVKNTLKKKQKTSRAKNRVYKKAVNQMTIKKSYKKNAPKKSENSNSMNLADDDTQNIKIQKQLVMGDRLEVNEDAEVGEEDAEYKEKLFEMDSDKKDEQVESPQFNVSEQPLVEMDEEDDIVPLEGLKA